MQCASHLSPATDLNRTPDVNRAADVNRAIDVSLAADVNRAAGWKQAAEPAPQAGEFSYTEPGERESRCFPKSASIPSWSTK